MAAVTANGELWHTVRLSNGSWLPFGSVKAATHNDPGDVTDVAVAAIAGELHLFVTTTNLGMWHNSPRERYLGAFPKLQSTNPIALHVLGRGCSEHRVEPPESGFTVSPRSARWGWRTRCGWHPTARASSSWVAANIRLFISLAGPRIHGFPQLA